MIKRMIKEPSDSIAAKASKGVPGLTDDQGPSDRKSDGKASLCLTTDGVLIGATSPPDPERSRGHRRRSEHS